MVPGGEPLLLGTLLPCPYPVVAIIAATAAVVVVVVAQTADKWSLDTTPAAPIDSLLVMIDRVRVRVRMLKTVRMVMLIIPGHQRGAVLPGGHQGVDAEAGGVEAHGDVLDGVLVDLVSLVHLMTQRGLDDTLPRHRDARRRRRGLGVLDGTVKTVLRLHRHAVASRVVHGFSFRLAERRLHRRELLRRGVRRRGNRDAAGLRFFLVTLLWD